MSILVGNKLYICHGSVIINDVYDKNNYNQNDINSINKTINVSDDSIITFIKESKKYCGCDLFQINKVLLVINVIFTFISILLEIITNSIITDTFRKNETRNPDVVDILLLWFKTISLTINIFFIIVQMILNLIDSSTSAPIHITTTYKIYRCNENLYKIKPIIENNEKIKLEREGEVKYIIDKNRINLAQP